MFNEAFWFFYLVSLTGSFEVFFMIVGVLGIIASLIAWIIAYVAPKENWADSYSKKLRWILPSFVLCVLMSMLMPPKEAFYAGAGQYVVEASETDQTLMNLKNLLDKKIEELADDAN